MHKILLSLFFLIIFIKYSNQYPIEAKIDYGDQEPEIPEYITTSTTRKPQKPLEGMAITFDGTPDEEIKNNFEKLGAVLCSFPEETLKTSPSLIFYCIFIAILWLFLIITLCLGYIRQIIDR